MNMGNLAVFHDEWHMQQHRRELFTDCALCSVSGQSKGDPLRTARGDESRKMGGPSLQLGLNA